MIPREALEHERSPCLPHASGARGITDEFPNSFAQLLRVSGRDEVTGLTVAHDLGHSADPARDYRRPAGHCFEKRQPQQLRDSYRLAVDGSVNGWKHEHLGASVKIGKIFLGGCAGKGDVVVGERAQEPGVGAFRLMAVVPLGSRDRQRDARRERLEEPVESLVRRHPSNKKNPAPSLGAGMEAIGVDTPVDDARPMLGDTENIDRVLRDAQEAVEESRQKAGPPARSEPVIGRYDGYTQSMRNKRTDPARSARCLMGMDQIDTAERGDQSTSNGMRWVAPDTHDRL
jgi:hypothetical protein